MSENFDSDAEIEEIIKLIGKDKSVIKKFNINELEILNEYLKNKKNYLNKKIGEC